ncbi:hypothetical protein KC19_3G080400 [Ceratodon purpureus]|uniref:Uncharacterized protein n=1 Tax=Ceratodon purpureus TaxID=3225 RepID=A0A8T0IJV4_CERPU|nr:hypothetical protein KC19_3G080400 [Ceratodon purpureus]
MLKIMKKNRSLHQKKKMKWRMDEKMGCYHHNKNCIDMLLNVACMFETIFFGTLRFFPLSTDIEFSLPRNNINDITVYLGLSSTFIRTYFFWSFWSSQFSVLFFQICTLVDMFSACTVCTDLIESIVKVAVQYVECLLPVLDLESALCCNHLKYMQNTI